MSPGSHNGRAHTGLRVFLPFLLICLFALSAIAVAVSGLRVYLGIQEDADHAYQARTGVSYVATRLRGAGGPESVSIRDNVLTLTDWAGGDAYETTIFLKDGQLCEQTGKKGIETGAKPETIVPASAFTVSYLSGNLVTFTVTGADGQQDSRTVYLGEGGPVT